MAMSQSLTIEYPDSLPDSLHLSRSEFEHEARMAMAVKLFDRGRLTSGQAAELAGMPRVHFLYELGRWGVSALQTTPEELAQDIATAQQLHDGDQR
jgi:predicted HTH domain antitoxin